MLIDPLVGRSDRGRGIGEFQRRLHRRATTRTCWSSAAIRRVADIYLGEFMRLYSPPRLPRVRREPSRAQSRSSSSSGSTTGGASISAPRRSRADGATSPAADPRGLLGRARAHGLRLHRDRRRPALQAACAASSVPGRSHWSPRWAWTACRNAAPMSFFNVFAQTPPLLILGLQDRAARPQGHHPQRPRPGRARRQPGRRPAGPAMVACSVDHPPEIDETEVAGLTLAAVASQSAPAASPRPRSRSSAAWSARSTIPAAASCSPRSCTCTCATPASTRTRLRVRPEHYRPVARMHGDWYVTAEDWYELLKPTGT